MSFRRLKAGSLVVLRCFGKCHRSVDSILLVSKIEIPLYMLYWFPLYWFIWIHYNRTSMYVVQSTEPLTCWKVDTLHILKWLNLQWSGLLQLQKLGALTPALHVLLQPWCDMDDTIAFNYDLSQEIPPKSKLPNPAIAFTKTDEAVALTLGTCDASVRHPSQLKLPKTECFMELHN